MKKTKQNQNKTNIRQELIFLSEKHLLHFENINFKFEIEERVKIITGVFICVFPLKENNIGENRAISLIRDSPNTLEKTNQSASFSLSMRKAFCPHFMRIYKQGSSTVHMCLQITVRAQQSLKGYCTKDRDFQLAGKTKRAHNFIKGVFFFSISAIYK